MLANKAQIMSLLREGLTTEEVGVALGYEAGAVETLVVMDKEVERSSERNSLERKFTALQDIALDTLHQIMAGSNNDRARLGAATYVLDQRLGLKKATSNFNVNINDFNVQLERARKVKEAVLDVESQAVMA